MSHDQKLRDDITAGVIANEVLLSQVHLAAEFNFALEADKQAKRSVLHEGLKIGFAIGFMIGVLLGVLL